MRTFLFLLMLSALFVGCTQTSQTDIDSNPPVETVNTVCPIMGGEVAADGGSAEWDGKVVGFCCPGCESKWEELTDEQKAEKLAESKEGDHSHGDHDHS
ncbi:MAG: hypothetical protein NXI22_20040 [bacterium]|nr:hypothetical protein [bacterium]